MFNKKKKDKMDKRSVFEDIFWAIFLTIIFPYGLNIIFMDYIISSNLILLIKLILIILSYIMSWIVAYFIYYIIQIYIYGEDIATIISVFRESIEEHKRLN